MTTGFCDFGQESAIVISSDCRRAEAAIADKGYNIVLFGRHGLSRGYVAVEMVQLILHVLDGSIGVLLVHAEAAATEDMGGVIVAFSEVAIGFIGGSRGAKDFHGRTLWECKDIGEIDDRNQENDETNGEHLGGENVLDDVTLEGLGSCWRLEYL